LRAAGTPLAQAVVVTAMRGGLETAVAISTGDDELIDGLLDMVF